MIFSVSKEPKNADVGTKHKFAEQDFYEFANYR